MEKKCLVVRYPQESGPAWHGHCGPNRRIVAPGHTFNGREGVVGSAHPSGEWYRDTTQHTGWYVPVGWLTADEAQDALTVQDSEGHEGDSPGWEQEYVYGIVTTLLGGPDDFPGLQEHYPGVVAAFNDVVASVE